MRGCLVPTLALVAACAVPPAVLVVTRVEPAVREAIAADWPPPVETLRCLSYVALPPQDVAPWLVTGVRRVPNLDATPFRVRGECPDSTVALHDHLPLTCGSGIFGIVTCRAGGDLDNLCAPSESDRRYLRDRPHQPFNALRCDARALVFYTVR